LPLIRPFAALRPVPQRAAEVAAPPYDVVSTEEARARAVNRPWSFLHISKPEIDLPPGTDPYSPAVYAKAAENLRRMLASGVVARDLNPCYYAYRLVFDDHVQTGLVMTASIAEYNRNRIRKHEFTRPDKEDDRVHQIEALNAQTGPVLLAYPAAPQVEKILSDATSEPADTDVVADGGVHHSLWPIRGPGIIANLTAAFNGMSALYIADGHHRSAAASRVAASRRARNAEHTGEESYEYFLAVAFPHNQMTILPYHRVVTDLNGLSPERFLERLRGGFNVEASTTPVTPNSPGQFGVYLSGRWYRIFLRAGLIPIADPVARLDVSLLADHLLAPILGIRDPRRDKRIDFVGGIRGLPELERRVDRGEAAAAFSMHPTRMEDLMAVSDRGEVMPPKSTWFEPKLADGLVSHVLD
jgi:uncharacterized protein (DUF1015 family)